MLIYYNKSKFNLQCPFIAFGKAGQIFGKGGEKGGERNYCDDILSVHQGMNFSD